MQSRHVLSLKRFTHSVAILIKVQMLEDEIAKDKMGEDKVV